MYFRKKKKKKKSKMSKCINRGKMIRVIKKAVQEHTQTKPGMDKCKCVNAMDNNLAKDS